MAAAPIAGPALESGSLPDLVAIEEPVKTPAAAPAPSWQEHNRNYVVQIRASVATDLPLMKGRSSAVLAGKQQIGVAMNFREQGGKVVCTVEMCKESWPKVWNGGGAFSVRGFEILGPLN